MSKHFFLKILLIFLLVSDFSYSFYDYYNTKLDGDLAGGIVPATDVQKIFDDPTGLKVIFSSEKHSNPNRYFAHLFFRDYFRTMPFFVQNFVNPIESIYLSCAIAKLIMQIFILFFISYFITGTNNILNINFLIVAVLIIPMFQTHGYYSSMGIIDKATTYTFFYALPLILLLWYFSFFYKIFIENNKVKFSIRSIIILSILTIILPLSGPLIPPILLVASLVLYFYYLKKHYLKNKPKFLIISLLSVFKNIPLNIKLLLLPINILSIYSLFLGTYNNTYPADLLPLTEQYLKLIIGIYREFAYNLGIALLFITIIINVIIIKRKFLIKEGQKIVKSFYWIGIFTIIYILLLPLGGYRPYRPYILRYDTFLPVTISFIYIYGISTFFLLQNIKIQKNIYVSYIIAVLMVYTIVDKSNFDDNKCQKLALQEIANSNNKNIVIKHDCTVMTWEKIYDYNLSLLNAELLKYWNITNEKKLYINKKD